MSSTLFAAVSLLSRFHAMLRRPAATNGTRKRHAPPARPLASPASGHCAASTWPIARAAERACHVVPPLRVLRIEEAGQHAAQGGRMVISGRMADVCAELDRMVAREAALHAQAR